MLQINIFTDEQMKSTFKLTTPIKWERYNSVFNASMKGIFVMVNPYRQCLARMNLPKVNRVDPDQPAPAGNCLIKICTICHKVFCYMSCIYYRYIFTNKFKRKVFFEELRIIMLNGMKCK